MILKIHDRFINRKVDFFNNFNLSLRYDSIGSTFAFDFYYNPDNADHRQIVCVSHYHDVTLEHENQILLSGRIVSNNFNSDVVRELISISGYSFPGVLEDCNIPPSVYPIQYDGLSLKEIAEKIISPFKLKMVIDPAVLNKMQQPIVETTAEPTVSVKQYLTDLATQKNIIISHTPLGELFFTEAKANSKPVFIFEKGLNGTKMNISFNGQGIHSHITVVKQQDKDGGNAGQYTIQNPFCPIVYRPKVVIQNSGEDVDIVEVAKNELASELKNITLNIDVDRWDIGGKLLTPNIIISVKNPELYLFDKTDWFVESISYKVNSGQQTASLTCVRPEVYNGKTPINVFVADHYKQNA